MVLNFLPGRPRAPGAMGTGWSCSSSPADPASSLVVGLRAVPANVVSQQLSELFSESGIYFAIQAGLCSVHASQVLGIQGHTTVGSCLFGPLRKERAQAGSLGSGRVVSEPQEPGFSLGERCRHAGTVGRELTVTGNVIQG